MTGDKNFMSVEYMMTSNRDQGGKCRGSYFMATAPVTQGGLAAGKDCGYSNGQQGCASNLPVYGPTQSVRLIDPSPKSIATALYQHYPVSNTIGADGNFQQYSRGIFNACPRRGGQPTNHETVIIGYDCESSTGDAGKMCQFDANGKLPPGIGYWVARNSWGQWGEKGFYRIKMTAADGSLCNNMAEEVGIIETGVPVPAPVPPTPVPVPVPIPVPVPATDSHLVLIIGFILAFLTALAALIVALRKK